jgi:hypothetical protein
MNYHFYMFNGSIPYLQYEFEASSYPFIDSYFCFFLITKASEPILASQISICCPQRSTLLWLGSDLSWHEIEIRKYQSLLYPSHALFPL